MRERVTFVQPRGSGVDPKSLKLSQTGLTGPIIDTVREDRVTLTPDELPTELASLLTDFQEFDIRWASATAYDTLEPFASRISPGFHLSYVLREGVTDYDPSKLCKELRRFGSFSCSSAKAFTSLSLPALSGPKTYFFHEELKILSEFSRTISSEVCVHKDTACQERLKALDKASSLDVSWTAESGKLKITALFPLWERTVDVSSSSDRRIEIGVLAQDAPPNMAAHETGLSGVLTVLGESTDPSPTLFSFPTRHRDGAGTFSSTFLLPTGLHPNLQITLHDVQRPAGDDTCSLFTYLTLPKTIFADRYQLSDDLFLASKNLTSLKHTTLPVDLEAPEWLTRTWGSNVLLELAQGSDIKTAQVPLHLRYLKPNSLGEQLIEIPYPSVFWACQSSAQANLAENPFDRSKLGYDSLFDEQTVFWHVAPKPVEGLHLMNEIKVPVLEEHAAPYIKSGTAVAVGLGLLWVLWVLLRVIYQTFRERSEMLEVKRVADERAKKR